jgi:hypothetical protein
MPRQGKPQAAMAMPWHATGCLAKACHGLPRQGKPRAAMAMPWHATGCLAKACHGQPRQWHRLQWPCQGLPWKRQRREWRWLQQPCQDNAKAMQYQGNAKECQWVTRQCRGLPWPYHAMFWPGNANNFQKHFSKSFPRKKTNDFWL